MEPVRNPITRQPTATANSVDGGGGPSGDGLDFLARLSLLVIHQKQDGIPLNVTPPSSAQAEGTRARLNRYTVLNGNGDKVYIATETESEELGCNGMPQRPFEITVIDPRQRIVLRIHRPCSAALFCSSSWSCCCCWCGRLGGKVNVALPDGTFLGQVVHAFRCCYIPHYNVYNAAEKRILRIRGRACSDCCCCSSELFKIWNSDGREVGSIAHNVTDEEIKILVKEAESLTVKMDDSLDVTQKALVMASALLIDYMYFDSSIRTPTAAQARIRPRIYPALTKE